MFLYFRRGLNPPAAPPVVVAHAEVQVPLGLSVERRGNDLRDFLEWQRTADMSKADFGMLLIRGTSVSRDVPLPPKNCARAPSSTQRLWTRCDFS